LNEGKIEGALPAKEVLKMPSWNAEAPVAAGHPRKAGRPWRFLRKKLSSAPKIGAKAIARRKGVAPVKVVKEMELGLSSELAGDLKKPVRL